MKEIPDGDRIPDETFNALIENCVEAIVPTLPKGIGFTIILSHVTVPDGDLQTARATSLTPEALHILFHCEMSSLGDGQETLKTVQRRDN